MRWPGGTTCLSTAALRFRAPPEPFAPSLAAGEIAGSAEPHAPAWYADKGVELMHSCVCVAADLDKKRLTLRTYAPGD